MVISFNLGDFISLPVLDDIASQADNSNRDIAAGMGPDPVSLRHQLSLSTTCSVIINEKLACRQQVHQ